MNRGKVKPFGISRVKLWFRLGLNWQKNGKVSARRTRHKDFGNDYGALFCLKRVNVAATFWNKLINNTTYRILSTFHLGSPEQRLAFL